MDKNYYIINCKDLSTGLNYVFSGFVGTKPVFEPIQCIIKGTKVYKTKTGAEKAIKKLEKMYNTEKYIIEIEEHVKNC